MRHSVVAAAFFLPLFACATSARAVQDEATITQAERQQLQAALDAQQKAFEKAAPGLNPEQRADIGVCLKAVQWALHHDEFPKKDYVQQSRRVLELAEKRLADVAANVPTHFSRAMVRGYRSKLDGSLQPYSISFPPDFDSGSTKSLPLYLKLHGRANAMNEVNFFHRYNGKPPAKDQTWIQLDVYGRGNNAYRWAGEVDVFEALADVKRRHRIDENRITLHGFSMGGAGAWHLGVHYPHLWSSVGPGAGFVDFYKYQNQTEKRPEHQHATLGIYDAIDYALNTFNVPVCTYGGEKDAQLLAGQSMTDAAKKLGIDVKLIVGPGMGHKFDPKSLQEFMTFHREKSAKGRPRFGQRRHIRFTTRTLKYNQCDWLAVEEIDDPYDETTVDAKITNDGTLVVQTQNATVLRFARGLTSRAEIDGTELPFETAADVLLPDVYYAQDADGDWSVIDYQASKAFPLNSDRHKRQDLQGPIDDAFTKSFVCVRPTGKPWSFGLNEWGKWNLKRFADEWHKWHRGELEVVDDTKLTKAMIASQNLILFGDPGSNKVIAQVLDGLPLKWTGNTITFAEQDYSTDGHGLSLIFPNPLNPRRYVVINSGHTFHERDFKASNSWLFPRLGDAAIVAFKPGKGPEFSETTKAAYIFDQTWSLPTDGAKSDLESGQK